jgi:hypothetical protein
LIPLRDAPKQWCSETSSKSAFFVPHRLISAAVRQAAARQPHQNGNAGTTAPFRVEIIDKRVDKIDSGAAILQEAI